jgi:hypothetical protein
MNSPQTTPIATPELPADAGVCAFDRDECTVTLALSNEDEVMALVRALPSRNRVWLAPKPEGWCPECGADT